MDLSHTTALVTGGGDGLGAVIAEHLAAHGTFVIVADVDLDRAMTTIAEVGGGEALEADVTHEVARKALVSAVAEHRGPYLLVNNAGGWGERQYPDSDEYEWREVLELNLLAPMALTQQLADTGALSCVVNISSSAARETSRYDAPDYAIAKAGLIRMTTALSGNPDGPRMNCIVPGWIGLPRAVLARDKMLPDLRPDLVDPHDIAREVVRLATDDAQDGQVTIMGR